MAQELLSIGGMTSADRHRVTSDIGDAISGTGGWIINHTLASNIALSLRFSVTSKALGDFRDRVIAADVKLNDESLSRIQTMTEKLSAIPTDITVTLNVTFIHDGPDLRQPVPAVPG